MDDYVLTVQTETATEGITTFQDFMAGLREIVNIVYGVQLPDNDYQAINLFQYGGRNNARDDPFRNRQGYSYYHDAEDTYTCVCKHIIKNLYFIVPKWSKDIHPRLAVGSTCIKRFQIRSKCRNCCQHFYIKPDDVADICPKCSKCCYCFKKKKEQQSICGKCLDTLKYRLQLIIEKRIRDYSKKLEYQRRCLLRKHFLPWKQQYYQKQEKIRCFINYQNHGKIVKCFFQWKKQYKQEQHKIQINKFILKRKRKIIQRIVLQYVQKWINNKKKQQLLEKKKEKQEQQQKQNILKQKKITEQIGKYDIKVYPRTSPLLQYWDKTYQEVFNLDQSNSEHPNPFKKYVSAKLLLMNNFS